MLPWQRIQLSKTSAKSCRFRAKMTDGERHTLLTHNSEVLWSSGSTLETTKRRPAGKLNVLELTARSAVCKYDRILHCFIYFIYLFNNEETFQYTSIKVSINIDGCEMFSDAYGRAN